MKVILTGSTGFVGSNLLRSADDQQGFEFCELNLRLSLPVALPSALAIIHLAGKAHDLAGKSDDKEYFSVNYGITKELYDLFLLSDVTNFFYFSTVKAAADTVKTVLHEDVSPRPKTPYGKSKLLAEEYILAQPLPPGKRVFILRPCMIHGPGNKGNLNLLFKLVKYGIPYPLAAFENRRSFLSIANVSFVINRLLHDPKIPGGIYNLADDVPLSTNQVVSIISDGIGRKPRLFKIKTSYIRSIAMLGDYLRLPVNSETLKKLTDSYVVSNEKIKAALNIKNFPVSSKDGLLNTIKSFHAK
jgi:nucleoside-diphosphate-sugar epimerase